MRKIKLVFEGGLGNQLFQLAYGMYLQGKYGCKVSYDVSKFKTEVASEMGVPFTEYNGNLSSKQCGSVGGEMVKRMVQQYESGIK